MPSWKPEPPARLAEPKKYSHLSKRSPKEYLPEIASFLITFEEVHEFLDFSSHRQQAACAEVGLGIEPTLRYAIWFLAEHMSDQLGNLNQDIVSLVRNRYLKKGNEDKDAWTSTSYVSAYFLANHCGLVDEEIKQRAMSLDPFERIIAAFCISIYSESIDRFLEETREILLQDSYEPVVGYFPIREAAGLQMPFA